MATEDVYGNWTKYSPYVFKQVLYFVQPYSKIDIELIGGDAIAFTTFSLTVSAFSGAWVQTLDLVKLENCESIWFSQPYETMDVKCFNQTAKVCFIVIF